MVRLPELTSLRLFVMVGMTGSITEAARLEGISQPAASKRVAALERLLAVALIQRTPAGSRLTPEGRVVADWAGRVLETVDQMSEAVGSMRSAASSDFRLASSMTIAEHLVPTWLSTLRGSHPALRVGLHVANSQEVQRLVLEGQADLGMIEAPTLDARLESRVFARDRLTVVVSPGHPWARSEVPLRPEDLAAAQLIVREPGSGTRETLDRVLASYAPVEPLLELGSNAAVRGAVRAGAGPAVLSVLAVRDDLIALRLTEVEVTGIDLVRPLHAVWPRSRPLDAPRAALLGIARGQSRKLGLGERSGVR
jgi:DNA-binding transcriptional LysR family regulator